MDAEGLTPMIGEGKKISPSMQRCVHGFQTLRDDTEVFCQMSDFHLPRVC